MASDVESERSPETRSLAEEALLRLLVTLADREADLVVLGGLIPEVLTRGQDAPTHLGTTDVDIHVSFHAGTDHDLCPLERALEEAGFEPDPRVEGWRWQTRISGIRVAVEFLCDRNDQAANQAIPLSGCQVLRAANLRGTGFVARDWVAEDLAGTLDGKPAQVRAKFAGLEGYLMAKAYAVRHRGAQKDYYDLVYV